MEFQSLVSSNIQGIAYNEAEHTLHVEFKNGGRYTYKNVPQDVYEDFLSAGSPGSFFASEIKDVYTFSKG